MPGRRAGLPPGLLLLDEPSSGLDPRGRRSLAALLRDLTATIIVASHDLVFIQQVCSRVIVLDGGVVAADGAAGGILGDGGLLGHGTRAVRRGWELGEADASS